MLIQRATFWQPLLGFMFMALFIWGGVALVHYLVSTFAGLNPNVAAAIVAGIATVFVSLVTVIVGKRAEAVALITKEQREKKIPVYESFIEFSIRYTLKKGGDSQLSEEEVRQFLTEYTQRMMVWGSDEVIAAWVTFRYSSIGSSPSTDGNAVLEQFEKIILAMRKDLGHKNKGFKPNDILRMFVNDL